jgi:hypothetical protein
MAASKSLPERPSLESLRKQAKKLARDVAAGDTAAVGRVRAQLPNVGLPLTQRNAQLVIAREYGFTGWHDLLAEVSQRLGDGLEWAATQARRAIHDNDVERLTKLVGDFPQLLSLTGGDADRTLLGFATTAYGDAFDPERERNFTRAECAELLIDAGAVVLPAVPERIVAARARGLLQLFRRKGLLPQTLKYAAALGDLDAVRTSLGQDGNDLAEVDDAFLCACSFEHETVASVLLDRSIALDPEFGRNVDASVGRHGFIRYLIERRSLTFSHANPTGPWQVFVMEHVMRAVEDGDLTAFVTALQHDLWLLDDNHVEFQVGMIERAVMRDRSELIGALLELDPALGRRRPPPPSQAIEFALTYEKPHFIPLLTRLWPLPDDLPHAAGTGDLARVKRWFDPDGTPALGDLEHQYPYNLAQARKELPRGAPRAQRVLDSAFAFAVINRHFDVADFLLERGADINTTWNSHEPASILHELVFHDNYESMQFLIDRGIDMTITDYRWNSTARGWARYGANDQRMADWLEAAERQRNQGSR